MLYLIRHIYDGNIFSYLNPILKSIKLRLEYPDNKIGLITNNKKFINNNDELNYLLSSLFDDIYDNSEKIDDEYSIITSQNNNYLIGGLKNNNFNVFNMLEKLHGESISNLFTFKELELSYKLNMIGGDFERKIKNKMTQKENLTRIMNIFNIDEDKINLSHIKYFFTFKQNIYRPFNITSMLSKIKAFDFKRPLKILSKYFNDQKFLKINNKEYMINMYLKSRPKIHVITLWRPLMINNKKVINSLIKYLEGKGNVYYFKEVELSKIELENYLFLTYDDFTFSRRSKFVNKKLDYILSTDKNNKTGFIFFDNVNNHDIIGHNSKFKKELREFIKSMILNENVSNEIRVSDLIHINNYFYQSIDIGNSILLGNVNFELKYMKNNIFQTFKKLIFSNLSLLEIERILIDKIEDNKIYGKILTIKDGGRINDFVQKYLINDDTKLFFCNFSFTQDTNLFIDPKNFHYNQSIKFYNMS
jgi:hypothetical protein